MDAQFAKYDTDQSGHLEREQLRAFLQDLSKGKEVEDGDLDFVLEKVRHEGAGFGALAALLYALLHIALLHAR